MASPPDITMRNLNGSFVQNNGLSDSMDGCMKLQGVPFFVRQVMRLTSIQNALRQYTDETGLQHIEITTIGVPGKGDVVDDRILDWATHEQLHGSMGYVETQSRIVTDSSVEVMTTSAPEHVKFLNAEISTDGKCTGGSGWDTQEPSKLQTVVKHAGNGWTNEQIWGFELIDNVRYHVRRMIVKKGEEVERARLVFNYEGPRKG